MVYLNAGYLALTEDRPAEALRLLQLATPAAEQLETPASMMSVLGNMGLANLFIGDHRAREKPSSANWRCASAKHSDLLAAKPSLQSPLCSSSKVATSRPLGYSAPPARWAFQA